MAREPLSDLEQRDEFIRRHIGPGDEQIVDMLDALGLKSLDDLIAKAVPKNIITDTPLDIGSNKTERGTLSYLRRMSERNKVFVSMIGMGYSGAKMPSVILRNVMEHPGWYTAYTPYQAEISQGRLEACMNFQQMVMDLTGMEIANASLLDEGTAAAEAMAMAHRLCKTGANTFFVADDCHPQTIAVVKTRGRSLGFDVVTGDPFSDLDAHEFFGVLAQYPGSTGQVRDITPVIEAAHEKGALVTVASDLLALVLMKPPGEMGADMVVGSSQRFGVPMGYGGPHAAFFATRDTFKRQMPGRIIGVSVDSQGRPALRMALQTREQHIRREKATSNICTSQVLLAVLAGMYAVYHGPDELKKIARKVHRMTRILAEGLKRMGFEIETEAFFDTLCVVVPGQAGAIAARAREQRINLRIIDGDRLGISLDETTRRKNLSALWKVFSTKGSEDLTIEAMDEVAGEGFPEELIRTTPYMEHPVFHLYHGETEMMRYLRRLAAKDIALNRSMIPLGSCTMKLNSATEMIPVSWRNFSAMHPFAPLEQAQGYRQLFEELEAMLCEVTGFDAISLQPNAGSQGEYAGLLAIRKYQEHEGQGHRDICLIPASAHGTNPASANLAGLRVVVVACDDHGNVDLDDLKAKATEHADNLSALMITYPSTHGVFEEAIREICQIIHDHGGQVYFDGANLNALVGISKPGEIGADVAHLNLHKTFAIPHGGGGPGVGPIGVLHHLAPFLPDHPLVEAVNPAARGKETIGTVAAAPWGSASILPISWSYMFMMKGPGLKRATEVAILSANYIAHRLSDHFPVLYTGKNGLVAHECIIDLRPIKESSGITVDDVAKRLVDYGFHSPTMSFPVADTLMIEPTESESKREVDRFCDAMITIRAEIQAVEDGTMDAHDNPLVNAPHTHHQLVSDDWTHPYSREQAFFPLPELHDDKYWPPVGRIDNVAGDRNLVCACPPMEAYAEAAE
ncbi:MAG: aminomethyl-transferring glycine dehydrogenase [Alphaproteobacteria bacterium]|jgi:glycine dehydrogenase|nr:aminomethyl-transferring glycine dehydrogenase [Alphaproteobacteria bacterium]